MIRITVPGEVMALVFLALTIGFTALVAWPLKSAADRAIDRHLDRRRRELRERYGADADQEGDA